MIRQSGLDFGYGVEPAGHDPGRGWPVPAPSLGGLSSEEWL